MTEQAPTYQQDIRFMARAIRLARKGLFTTQPNPRVGCVLVRNGEIVGEGWHQKAGQAHAEINALAEAGDRAQGATAYVTLEPCSHHGKTGPCADALVAAGVTRVVAAMRDPNPLVSGNGLDRLKAANIDVADGLLEAEAESLNPGFIKRMRTGLPHVHIKLAMSLDGRTAMASGESQWITGPAARVDVQRLRARSSAIVTGMGTVAFDDPSLTVRQQELGVSDVEFSNIQQPMRVVLDSRARLNLAAKVLQNPGRVLQFYGSGVKSDLAESASQSGAICELRSQVLKVGQDGRLDLKASLEYLAQEECNEVLVEAGAELAGAFVEQGLWDELHVYIAPKLLGSSARPLFKLPLDSMSQSHGLQLTDTRMFGDDIRLIYRPTVRGTD